MSRQSIYSYLISKPLSFLTPNGSMVTSDLKFNQVEPAPNHFNGNLYILINGGSFSATGLLISLLKYNHIGQFIGEESGGSYITSANKFQRNIELPNTKLGINNYKND